VASLQLAVTINLEFQDVAIGGASHAQWVTNKAEWLSVYFSVIDSQVFVKL